MDSKVIAAIIGAAATIGSVVTAFLLNQLAQKISNKKYRVKHNIRDISGKWNSKWIFPQDDGSEYVVECLDYIEIKDKNTIKGEGKSIRGTYGDKEWDYKIEGHLDEMGFFSGTWNSIIDSYKGSFLLKLRPNMRKMEGHVISVAALTDTETRTGKWIWKFKER